MSRRTQITLTDAQHAFLSRESIRSGVSLAELVRRAVDETYRPSDRRRIAASTSHCVFDKRPTPPRSADPAGSADRTRRPADATLAADDHVHADLV